MAIPSRTNSPPAEPVAASEFKRLAWRAPRHRILVAAAVLEARGKPST
jgi:hypothetical protein